MLIKDAIAYLEKKSINASDRFKVLTGFDTKTQSKVRDSGEFWFNALYNAKIIQDLEGAKATSSVGGFFSSMAAAALGSDLKGQLKAAYKNASSKSAEQTKAQENYIEIVATYLKKHQEAKSLATFDFADPQKLVSKAIEPEEEEPIEEASDSPAYP